MDDFSTEMVDASQVPRTVIDIDPYMCSDPDYLNATLSEMMSCLRFYGFCQASIITNFKYVGDMVAAVKETILAYEIKSPNPFEEEFIFEEKPIPLKMLQLTNAHDPQLRGAIITITIAPSRSIILP